MKPSPPQETPRPPRAADGEQPLSPARAFVVQFREPAEGAAQGFTGRAEHIMSGRATRFESAEELLAFLLRELGAAPFEQPEKA